MPNSSPSQEQPSSPSEDTTTCIHCWVIFATWCIPIWEMCRWTNLPRRQSWLCVVDLDLISMTIMRWLILSMLLRRVFLPRCGGLLMLCIRWGSIFRGLNSENIEAIYSSSFCRTREAWDWNIETNTLYKFKDFFWVDWFVCDYLHSGRMSFSTLLWIRGLACNPAEPLVLF